MKSVRTHAMAQAIGVGAVMFTSTAAFAADANSLVGIHWWGYYDYGVVDSAPAQMLDSQQLVNGQPYGGWDLEIINTHGPVWQNAPFFQPLYSDLYLNKKITPI